LDGWSSIGLLFFSSPPKAGRMGKRKEDNQSTIPRERAQALGGFTFPKTWTPGCQLVVIQAGLWGKTTSRGMIF
jgi:hypothetical protein